MHVQMCMYMCMYMYMCGLCICTCIHIYIYMCSCIHTFIYFYVCVHVYGRDQIEGLYLKPGKLLLRRPQYLYNCPYPLTTFQQQAASDYVKYSQEMSGQPPCLKRQRTKRPEDQGTRGPRDQRTKGPEDQGTRRPMDQKTEGPEDQKTRGPRGRSLFLGF